MKGNDASDLETLAALARDPEIRRLAHGRRMVRLLWDACQIPDFRKLADETHTNLCARVFDHIARDGRLPTDWLGGQIAGLARPDGDIDTLMQRLSGVRVWSYIAARSDWVQDAAHWQGRAREVEDLLSDALHERLTSRFVDRRATHLMRRLDAGDGQDLLSAVTRRGDVVVEGHPVGRVTGFGFAPDPEAQGDERKLVLRAARRALREEMPRRVAALLAAPDREFGLSKNHAIVWDEVPVALLVRGNTVLRPAVRMLDSEFLDGAQRERLRARLQRFIDDRIDADLAPLFAAVRAADSLRGARGLLHRLTEALGLIPNADRETIAPELRTRLRGIGVRAGRLALFLPNLLKPRPAAMRARLWALQAGLPVPDLPAAGLVSFAPPAAWPFGFAAAMGWIEAGPMLLRLDVAERVAGELGWAARDGAATLPPGLASRFSIKADLLPIVLRRLGFRIVPGAAPGPDEYGPPAAAMLVALRRRRPPVLPPVPEARPHGPFAALADLKR